MAGQGQTALKVLLLAALVQAAPFASSSILGLRINGSSQVVIDEIDAGTGVVLQSLPAPAGCAVDSTAITLGFLSSGFFTSFGCFNASDGSRRMVANIDASGSLSATTALASGAFPNGVATALSIDGVNAWAAGFESSQYARIVATRVGRNNASLPDAPVAVGLPSQGIRKLAVYWGQLYALAVPIWWGYSSSTVLQIGTGLPMGSAGYSGATSTVTPLKNMNNAYTSYAPTSFLFSDPGTLWITDSDTGYGTGGLWMFTRDSATGNWVKGDSSSPWRISGVTSPMMDIVSSPDNPSVHLVLTQAGALWPFDMTTRSFAAAPIAAAPPSGTPAWRSLGSLPNPAAFVPTPSPTPQPLSPQSLVVLQAGNGTLPLGTWPTAAVPLVLVEVEPLTGVVRQRIPVPSVTVNGSRTVACLGEGTPNVPQLLLPSTDGSHLLFGCYEAPLYAPYPSTSNSPGYRRVIGRLFANGTVDTSLALPYSAFPQGIVGALDSGSTSATGAVLALGTVSGYDSRIRAVFSNGTHQEVAALPGYAQTLTATNTNGSLYALVMPYYWTASPRGPFRIGSSGVIPDGGTGGLPATNLLPYTTFGGSSTNPTTMAFQSPDVVWICDGSNAYGSGGLYKFVTNASGGWVQGDPFSPFMPPSNSGIGSMASRWEGGQFILYVTSPAQSQSPRLYRFDTSSSTWTDLGVTSLGGNDIWFKSIAPAPCQPGVNGPCDAVAMGAVTSLSATPRPSPSSSRSPVPATQRFAPGSLLLLRAGNGSAAVSTSYAAPLWLDEIDATSGALLRSIPVPTAASGAHLGCTREAGRALSLTLSSDGSLALFTCLDAPVGAYDPANTPAQTAPYKRVVARVGADGSVDTSTYLSWSPFTTSFPSTGAFAAGAASKTSPMYVAGYTSMYNAEMRYVPLGTHGSGDAPIASQFGTYYSPSVTAWAADGVTASAGGQLTAFLGTPWGSNSRAVVDFGVGLPTGTKGQSSTTFLPGMVNAYTGGSTRGFVWQSPSQVWVVDDSNVWGSGGLWYLRYDSTSRQWVNGDIASPFQPPGNPGLASVSGRVEAGGYALYVLSTAGAAYRFNATTYTFAPVGAYASSATKAYLSLSVVPCEAPSACMPLTTDAAAAGLAAPLQPPAPVSLAAARPFRVGSVLALRVGTGGEPLSNTAAPIFVEEQDPFTGAVRQVIALPTSGAGAGNAPHACTLEGSPNSQYPHYLSPSGSGRFVYLTCLDTPVGTADPERVPSYGSSARRVVVRIAADGRINVTALAWSPFSTAFTGGIITAASYDDGAVYTLGQEGSSAVVRITASPGVDGVDVPVTDVNAGLRLMKLQVAQNQLYGLLSGER